MSDSDRRWYDREPLAIWLPLTAVAAATVQTVAYVGYKLFYNSFGVRPEEVGYDYASLFPRSAFQLALLITAALALLCGISVTLAIYGVLLKPVVDDLRGRNSPATGVPVRAFGTLLVCAVVSLLISNWTGIDGRELLLLLLVLSLVLLLAGHVHARAEGRPETSLLSHLMAPRVYRASRRLVLLALAVSIAAWVTPSVLGSILLLILLYGIDRAFPVAPSLDTEATGGGTSKWLWRAGALGATGVLAFGFLLALNPVLDVSKLDEKVDAVRAGQQLEYSLLDPLTLAEPRADLVRVRWVGPRPPDEFASDDGLALTYLGQSNGTAVLLDAARTPQVVYRLPAPSITIESSARSILLD